MSAPARFKQADVTKALRAAQAAGLKPSGYKVEPTGAIVVMLGSAPAKAANSNPWDEELAR